MSCLAPYNEREPRASWRRTHTAHHSLPGLPAAPFPARAATALSLISKQGLPGGGAVRVFFFFCPAWPASHWRDQRAGLTSAGSRLLTSLLYDSNSAPSLLRPPVLCTTTTTKPGALRGQRSGCPTQQIGRRQPPEHSRRSSQKE